MGHERLRARVADIAIRMHRAGLAPGTSGNVSARDPASGHIVITPTGMPYDSLTAEHMVVVDLYGNVLDGSLAPSSETPMHTAVYRRRSDIHGVVHTHSRFATSFACANQPIPATHYLIAFAGREIIPVAGYATYGTEALAEKAVEALEGGGKAVLLANHGVLAVGTSVEEAYNIASVVEFVAEMHYRALQIGRPSILPAEEVHHLTEKFKTYGQSR